MALIDNLREKVVDATRTAVRASSDFIEVTKINMAAKSEEEKMKAILLDIGKYIYDSYNDGKQVDAELSAKCDEISDCEKNIVKLKQSVLEIKNLKKCNICSSEISKSDIFCPKCGQRVEDQV